MARFVLTAQLQLQAPNNVAQVVSQIQNQLNGINVNVQVQGSARAQQQIQQITQSTNQATSAADRMGRAFAVSIRRFAAFSIATRAVGLFTSTLSDAIQTSIDFERQLIKVAQVTGKSVGGLRDLTDEITRLSTGFGVSSQSLLEVTTVLTQAGLSASDTKIALNSLAQAALAPNFDNITQTAEGAIAILAQFQQGVGALEGQLGSINAVAGAFAVEASDLIDVIRRSGGVFKSSGGSLNELLALFTSVRATTRESAESIGTGLRTIFTRIQRPETITFLKQFGVNLLDLEGKFVGPFEAVKRLSGALSGLGERDITFIKIAEELGGFRQIGKVLPLLQQFSTAQAALNVATNANNSLSQDAASAQAALAVRITKVREEFLALIRSMTETSTFQIMANTALTLASALIKIADSIKPLLPLLAAVAAFRAIRGIGTFVGATAAGLQSGRTFNKGGKVHHFATGGLVPGVGNSDTVPAMLSPGEFVIRKSSVQKLGASNLAGMNNGGSVGKYADGGIVNEKKIGAAILENVGFDQSNTVTVSRQNIESKLPKGLKLSDNYPVKGQKSFTLEREGLSNDTYSVFRNTLRGNLVKVAEDSAKSLAADLGLSQVRTSVPSGDVDKFLRGINDGSMGNLFEDTLKVLSGSPFSTEPQRAFDFERGISSVLKDDYRNITAKYVDAKSSFAQSTPGKFEIKAANALAYEAQLNNYVRQESEDERKKRASSEMKAAFGKSKSSKKKHFGGMISKFATGGGVGTDTVPALLTPGEFVVNRSSAQRIGYGNLNRMNRVGKYANGGVVQRFASGTGITGAQSVTAPSGAGAVVNTQVQATQRATQATNQFGLGISLVSGSLQAILPPINDSSSAMQKFGNSVLSMITTIGGVVFALEGFGISLTKQSVGKFLSGNTGRDFQRIATKPFDARARSSDLRDSIDAFKRGGSTGIGQRVPGLLNYRDPGTGSDRDILRGLALRRNKSGRLRSAPGVDVEKFIPEGKNIFRSLSGPIGKVAFQFGKLAGPLAIAYGLYSLANAAILAFSDAAVKQKKAIEAGDVRGAGEAASSNYDAEAGLIGLLGPQIAESFTTLFGGNTRASVVALAEAQAQATKTQKAFEQGEKDAARAMEDFNRGAISATDALSQIKNVTIEANNLENANAKAIETNNANKSEGGLNKFARGLGSIVSLGYVESQSTRNARIDKENEGLNKSSMDAQRKAFEMRRPLTNEAMRSGILLNKDQATIDAEIQASGGESATSLKAKGLSLANQSINARNNGDADTANLLQQQSEAAYEMGQELENSFKNLSKEIETTRAAFDAMSLGLRSATSISSAQSASMTKFAAGLEVGGSSFVNDVAFLQEAMSSAAASMDPDEIKQSMENVGKNLSNLGVSPADVAKFEGNTNAFIQAQQNYGAAFDKIREEMKVTGKILSPDELKNRFADELSSALPDGAIKENLKSVIRGLELDQKDVEKIASGDKSVISSKLSESQQKSLAEIEKIAQDRQKAEQVLINLTKQRIEAERNFLEAQKEALSLTMEGRELQGKYGGKVVTNEERKRNILDRANVNNLGLSNMNTGSLSDIRGRNKEILDKFTAIEDSRTEQNGMQGVSGVRMDEMQKDLQKAQKDQINTIRELVKLEEENLKLIGEKNKLEKDSIDALVAGDIDKFMQTQATVGATAAIATGNKSLMGAFGPEALGLAAQDIRRQQEAGVQSLYGTQLAGQGGLTQQAFGSALGARGITDPRLAQVASGTTAEEEASKSRLRDLGTALGETGQLAVEMANMQLESAEINVNNATVKLNEIEQRGQDAVAALGKANGGLIYANRGMFIPRGTDTVPAMLTPGEFVVRREAVNRGNNLQLLQQMNGGGGGMTSNSAVMGFARGGRVQYYAEGGVSSSSGSGESFEKLTQALSKVMGYVNGVAESIKSLPTTISHQIADTKIDVNVAGGNMLNAFADNLESRLMNKVSEKLKNSYPTENGIHDNGSVLG